MSGQKETFIENDLEFDFTNALSARRFDDEKGKASKHGLTHCMSAVDFIVETEDRIFFIEVKDPDNPAIPARGREEFLKKMYAKQLHNDLKIKYRDSFIYEWAAERLKKPVYYIVLIALESLGEAELDNQSMILKRLLPVDGPPSGEWKKRIVAGCRVFNLTLWNEKMKLFPVKRISLNT